MEAQKQKLTNADYQKKYYEKNKTKLNASLCEPVICEFCNRRVIKNNIKNHQTRPICFKTQERNKQRIERTMIKI